MLYSLSNGSVESRSADLFGGSEGGEIVIGKGTRDVLSSFPDKAVLILGDVMLDEFIWGEVQRISPEAPVPVVEVRDRSYVAGGAANVAANVAKLQGRALLAGVVGHDAQCEQLRRTLAKCGVDGDGLVVDEARPTTSKTRVIAHAQQVVRVDCERSEWLPAAVESALMAWVAEQLSRVDVCILSDYGKGVASPYLAGQLIRASLRAGKPVVVDPKGNDYSKYRGATVVTPNVREARLALNEPMGSKSDLMELGRRLQELLPGSGILITRGAEGMSLFAGNRPPLHVGSVARTVFDVTGAGDTAVSTLALALAGGASLPEAARLANRAAGIVVGRVGTATVALEDLLQDLRGPTGTRQRLAAGSGINVGRLNGRPLGLKRQRSTAA